MMTSATSTSQPSGRPECCTDAEESQVVMPGQYSRPVSLGSDGDEFLSNGFDLGSAKDRPFVGKTDQQREVA